MQLTDEQVAQILEEAKPRLVEGLIEDVRSSMRFGVNDVIQKEILDCVRAFVKENILPDLIDALTENKEGILSVAPKLAEESVVAIATSLTTALGKQLENSWGRKKILEALYNL